MLAENIRNMVHESHIKGIELGRAEGRAEGRDEGRGEGMRDIIINFATINWGNLSHDLLTKLSLIADAEHLEAMSLLAFRAQSLQEFENIIEGTFKKSMQ